MTERTKSLQISKAVKERVWERDGGCCIYCGSPHAFPEAHYIPRSHGGLGVEENILTLCRPCHDRYDNSPDREGMQHFFRAYLIDKYPGWDVRELIYGKEQRC